MFDESILHYVDYARWENVSENKQHQKAIGLCWRRIIILLTEFIVFRIEIHFGLRWIWIKMIA